MSKPERDYSETLFLPPTDFPLRAGLPQKEPEILARWRAAGLYGEAVGSGDDAAVGDGGREHGMGVTSPIGGGRVAPVGATG